MTNPNSKLHASLNPLSTFLLTLTLFFALIIRVKSDPSSFNFPSFEPGALSILLDCDAKTTGGVLQLTNKDQSANPTPQSVGLSAYYGALHLSDAKTARVADFTTEFSFVVNTKGAPIHGDGFTFYLASLDFELPSNSSGGFLGIFNKETAFNTSLNQVVAVEFDSFANKWDPNFPISDSSHIGIDINSIRSVATASWPLQSQPHGSIGNARISYKSSSKILSVTVAYPNSPMKRNATVLSYSVNLGAVLPEWVLFGWNNLFLCPKPQSIDTVIIIAPMIFKSIYNKDRGRA